MSYVYFRLPHSTQIFRNKLSAEPEELMSAAELNGRRGFVIAPFAPTGGHPILLLPSEWEAVDVDADCHLSAMLVDADYEDEREHYAIDFHNCHGQLANGSFQKIVLARSSRLTATEHIDPLTLFARAARRYPRMFVALFSTDRSGTWLVATPETLLAGTKGAMQTMALAGTMKLDSTLAARTADADHGCYDDVHWSSKNVKEQRYVETYITECVEHFSDDFCVKGPYTARAGDLVHLRSDISFNLKDTTHLGDLINTLHPTPAICGIPKAATREFILDNEACRRSYYSGFCGLLDPDADTRLFVTLRCMQIDTDNTYRLYAGGGLLSDSDCQSEWAETEAKMNTMRQLFKDV